MEEKMEEVSQEVKVFEDVLEAKISKSIVADYDGTYNENKSHFEGEGMASLDNESKFTGGYKNGLFHGVGSFRWANGVLYNGDFKNGYIDGRGEYNWPDGSTYVGDIEYYKRQGTGTFTGGSGQVYEGTWKNGLRDGSGTLFYDEARSVSYKGEWQNGMRHGFGTMTYPSGNVYEGEWRENKKCGRGVMTWQDVNEIYIGQWDNNLANGEGEHIWLEAPQKMFQRQNCNIYRGSFKDGTRSGFGTFFYANGSQYTGEWEENEKNGKGYFVHPDGRIHFGIFEKDRMIFLTEESKESEAVTTQYKLNITELLGVLPAIDKAPSFKQHTANIERLLLRYNSSIRHLLQTFTSSAMESTAAYGTANSKRKIHPSMQTPSSWNKIDALFFSRRDIHQKLFTLRMQQLCQFARQCDIIGPSMTSYDVCMCVKMMHNEHSMTANSRAQEFVDKVKEIRDQIQQSEEQQAVAEQQQQQMEAAQSERSSRTVKSEQLTQQPPLPPPIVVDPEYRRAVDGLDVAFTPSVTFPTILDSTFESDIYTDMRFPIRDREFVEAFVRIIAELSSRKHGAGVSGGGLFDNVYRVLAEIMEPLSTEARAVSVFVSALYSEEVQAILFKYEDPLRSLWDQALEIAAANGSGTKSCTSSVPPSREQSARSVRSSFSEAKFRPRVKHIVKLFMALKGTAVAEEGCTVLSVLEALDKKGPSGDLASLDLEVCFDDFVELFCRLVVSHLWTFDPEEESGVEKDQLSGAVQKDTTSASVVQTALVKRLSAWLPLI